MPDRYLRVVAPIIAREARDNPSRVLDEIVTEIALITQRRGLHAVVVDMQRVAAGGDVLPAASRLAAGTSAA